MDDEPHLRSPFLEKAFPCPACGTEQPQYIFRSRLFRAGERESDQHVLDYVWQAPDTRPEHPPLYFVLYCRQCHFADIAEDYLSPGENPFQRSVVRYFQKAGERELLIIELMRRHLRYEAMDVETALLLHFLAIHIQKIVPPDQADFYKVARLLLRVAWLYRENPGRFDTPAPFFGYPAFPAFLKDLAKVWPLAVADEPAALAAAIPYFEKGVSADPRFADNRAYFAALGLTTDLMVRCNDFEAAFRTVRGLLQNASHERNRLQETLRGGDLDAAARRQARNRLDKVGDTIRETTELRKLLIERVQQLDQPVIDEVLAAYAHNTPEEKEKELVRRGIHDEVITRLKQEGQPLHVKKKTGFF